ncbi:hypothetical protein M9H77_13107 [Catharanthus roseus]|uniref:Uncharacterized protein n=1 Tax=Catharanthus roseus TaxID=4058 RepID=A0ACC0BJG1_CATRO|nr:hypothetical protein M9H77_13107 [Catharanthus roseus]
MGFERNNDGLLIRGGQQGSDDDDEENNGDEEEGNEPESMDEEDTNERGHSKRNEIKEKARTNGGRTILSNMTQILDRIVVMQAQINDRLYDLNDKIVDIQNRVTRLDLKATLLKAKNLGDQDKMKEKQVKPLKTLKTCLLVRDVLRKESSFL